MDNFAIFNFVSVFMPTQLVSYFSLNKILVIKPPPIKINIVNTKNAINAMILTTSLLFIILINSDYIRDYTNILIYKNKKKYRLLKNIDYI